MPLLDDEVRDRPFSFEALTGDQRVAVGLVAPLADRQIIGEARVIAGLALAHARVENARFGRVGLVAATNVGDERQLLFDLLMGEAAGERQRPLLIDLDEI